jgi:parvulin-like peptidyl-prolyl isomerase
MGNGPECEEGGKVMWKGVRALMPGWRAGRRLLLAAGFAAVVTLAFCWGRHGGLSQAKAAPPGDPFVEPLPLAPVSNSDYARRVVAYIHNNIPITREDLGEYLIARLGAERVEFLVNHRIIEHACQSKRIQISDAELNAQLADDIKAMGINAADFENKVLKRFNKTLFEYREDVVRPKLALAKFCQDRVTVTADDLKKAFEAKYGEKVQCRMIVLDKADDRRNLEIYEKVRNNEEEFDRAARGQFIAALGRNGGEVPPIHRHFGDPRIEKEAFSLKPGEVSSVIAMPDNTSVILKCVKHIPADTTKRMEEVHLALHKEIFDAKLAQEIPKVFEELRKQANPVVFLRKQVTQAELERNMPQLMGAAGANAPPAASAPAAASAPSGQAVTLPAVTAPKAPPPQGK